MEDTSKESADVVTSVDQAQEELKKWIGDQYVDIGLKKHIYRVRDGDDFYLIYKGKPYKKSNIKLLSHDYNYIDRDKKVHNVLEDMLDRPPDSDTWPICELEIDFSKPYGRIPDTEKFNLFTGFKTQPKETGADTSIIWNHIKEVLANNNEDWNRYICSWIADMFQHPSEKPFVSLCFNGDQGTGKGLIFENLLINKLIGNEYGLHTVDDPFENRFTGQVGGKLLVNIDEGGWSLDKKSAGKLKSFISSPTFEIEKKGKDRYSVRNDARLVFTTNSEWIATLDNSDRRYAVFSTSNIHCNDRVYFNNLAKAILNDQVSQQFLYELMHYEITIDLKDIPETDARIEQKKQSKGYVGQYIDLCREDFGALQLKDNCNIGWVQDHGNTYRIGLSDLLTLLKSKYGPSLNAHRLSKELKDEGLIIERTMVEGVRNTWVYFDLDCEEPATSTSSVSSKNIVLNKNNKVENDVAEVAEVAEVVKEGEETRSVQKDMFQDTGSIQQEQEDMSIVQRSGVSSMYHQPLKTIEDTIINKNGSSIWRSDGLKLTYKELQEYGYDEKK